MKSQFKASITYDTDADHPDAPSATGLIFTDVYTVDHNYFSSTYDIHHYIKNDLSIVAGGGYDHKHITNVKFNITQGVAA